MEKLDASGVAHIWPVLQVLALVIGLVGVIVVGQMAGFRWLKKVIVEEAQTVVKSFADASEHRHAAHERAIEELKDGLQEQKQGLKRVHSRVDAILEKLA
jgi:hypothetical protein